MPHCPRTTTNDLNGSCAQGRKFGDTVVVDLAAILSIPEFVAWLESVETPSFEGSVCANKSVRQQELLHDLARRIRLHDRECIRALQCGVLTTLLKYRQVDPIKVLGCLAELVHYKSGCRAVATSPLFESFVSQLQKDSHSELPSAEHLLAFLNVAGPIMMCQSKLSAPAFERKLFSAIDYIRSRIESVISKESARKILMLHMGRHDELGAESGLRNLPSDVFAHVISIAFASPVGIQRHLQNIILCIDQIGSFLSRAATSGSTPIVGWKVSWRVDDFTCQTMCKTFGADTSRTKNCHLCARPGIQMQRCSRCKSARYCSKEHQVVLHHVMNQCFF